MKERTTTELYRGHKIIRLPRDNVIAIQRHINDKDTWKFIDLTADNGFARDVVDRWEVADNGIA